MSSCEPGFWSAACAKADRALAADPYFGDSTRIHACVLARYRFGVELFRDALPSLSESAAALAGWSDEDCDLLFRDPGLRLAMERAFTNLERGRLSSPDPIEDFLPAAMGEFAAGYGTSYSAARLSTGKRLGDGRSPWIGRFHTTNDPRLEPLCQNFVGWISNRTECIDPYDRALKKLRKATALLASILPHVGKSALGHISAVGLLHANSEEGVLLSGTGGDFVPSTIVLSPSQLENPWDAAGHLLHEGLHAKLFDVVRSHSLLNSEKSVFIPWREVRFTLIRALFSFHVYVHMLLFKAAAEHIGQPYFLLYGEPRSYRTRAQAMSVAHESQEVEYGRSIDRAMFFADKLTGEWSCYLSTDGRRLVQWLMDCIAQVEPALAPQVDRESDPKEGRNSSPSIITSPSMTTRGQASLEQVPGLKMRPLPELGYLLLFNPEHPKLHWLNPKAWLIFELCDGRAESGAYAQYAEVFPGGTSPGEIARELREGIDELVRLNLVRTARSTTARSRRRGGVR
jgi:hypothetical protein